MEAPISGSLEMQTRISDNSLDVKNIYKGKPRQELDDAWDELMTNTHIRVQGEELEKMGLSSISLSDSEGGYFAAVGKCSSEPRCSRC